MDRETRLGILFRLGLLNSGFGGVLLFWRQIHWLGNLRLLGAPLWLLGLVVLGTLLLVELLNRLEDAWLDEEGQP